MKKTLKIVSNVVTWILFACLLMFAFLAISSKLNGGQPTVFGYQIKSVLSGSMEPVFHTGSIIAVKPVKPGVEYKKGDVITFKLKDNQLVTHRVDEVTKKNGQVLYKTKGDANKTPDVDPVLSQNVVGSYTGFTIPYAGYVANYAQSKTGSSLLLVIPGVLLLLYALSSIVSAFRQIDDGQKNSKASQTL